MAQNKSSIDTDGLIGYWNYEDTIVNKRWIDRINSMVINLAGTAQKTNDGIRLNNLSKPNAAFASLDASRNALLNQYIDKEFTCIVHCLVKYTQTNMYCSIIDFGSFCSAYSGISLMSTLGQLGYVGNNAKYNGNSSSGYSETLRVATQPTPLEQYVDVSVKCGVRLVEGKQEVYNQYKDGYMVRIANNPLKINFKGMSYSFNTSPAFGLGVCYLNNTAAVQEYASKYLNDIIYKQILIYNKVK